MGVDARADDPDYRPSLTVRVTYVSILSLGRGAVLTHMICLIAPGWTDRTVIDYDKVRKQTGPGWWISGRWGIHTIPSLRYWS